MTRLIAFLRWLLGPQDLVSVDWIKDYARREGGVGIDQSSVDWESLKRRQP